MNRILVMSIAAALSFTTASANDKVPKSPAQNFIPWGGNAPMPFAGQPRAQFPVWNTPQSGQFPPMNYGNVMPMQYFVPVMNNRPAQAYPYRYPVMPYNYGNKQQRPMAPPSAMRNPYAWPGQAKQKSFNPSKNSFPTFPMNGSPLNFASPNMQASKMSPFGNNFSPSDDMAKNMPTPWKDSGNWNPWSKGQNQNMPFLPKQNNSKKKAWGSVRNIWPDFYTEFTDEAWDKSTNAPYDMGRMPGGWRAPSLSSPDPVTVGDAVLNQFPPIMEEMGNMMDFAN